MMVEFDWLELWKMVLIGLIQGFTEPIPVSSSGHVMIASELLGLGEQGFTFIILTNTASLLAILYMYRRDLTEHVSHTLKYVKTRNDRYKHDFFFVTLLIIGTIPAGVLGLLLNDFIEVFSSMRTIALMLLVTGLAIWFIRHKQGHKGEQDLSKMDAFTVGVAQAFALFPGISRSGATVIASIAIGMKQDTALKFSFLLYIPVSVGGMILGFSDFLQEPDKAELAVPYAVTFIAALLMTYVSLKWFMGIMRSGKLVYFAYYCFLAGGLLLIWN